MIAGGKDNLPDIIDNVDFFEGGATSAYEKGYIIELNDQIDQYAPNFKKYLEEHPEIDKLVKTDDGKYLTFPLIRGSDELCSFNGLIVRKDWLDEAGWMCRNDGRLVHTLTTFRMTSAQRLPSCWTPQTTGITAPLPRLTVRPMTTSRKTARSSLAPSSRASRTS